MNNSFELLEALKNAGIKADAVDENWWPNSGSFEVVIGAILTQQTKWEKVERSLKVLRDLQMLDIEKLAKIDSKLLGEMIKASGFYNTKAKRIKMLCRAILKDFGDFETFKTGVTRAWLLSQLGIAGESADAILCYACEREVMVVDSYTDKLLRSLGYEFESYEETQEWLMRGIEENLEKIENLYDRKLNLFTIYSLFHGKIIEFSKSKKEMREILPCNP